MSGQTDADYIWVLSTMNEAPISTRITITFPEEGRIVGQAPCNRYFGAQTVPMPWFEITGLGATKMACAELDLETQYFNLLTKMTTAELINDVFILRGDADETLIFNKN